MTGWLIIVGILAAPDTPMVQERVAEYQEIAVAQYEKLRTCKALKERQPKWAAKLEEPRAIVIVMVDDKEKSAPFEEVNMCAFTDVEKLESDGLVTILVSYNQIHRTKECPYRIEDTIRHELLHGTGLAHAFTPEGLDDKSVLIKEFDALIKECGK